MFLLFKRIPHKHSSIFFYFFHLNIQNFRHMIYSIFSIIYTDIILNPISWNVFLFKLNFLACTEESITLLWLSQYENTSGCDIRYIFDFEVTYSKFEPKKREIKLIIVYFSIILACLTFVNVFTLRLWRVLECLQTDLSSRKFINCEFS